MDCVLDDSTVSFIDKCPEWDTCTEVMKEDVFVPRIIRNVESEVIDAPNSQKRERDMDAGGEGGRKGWERREMEGEGLCMNMQNTKQACVIHKYANGSKVCECWGRT